MIRNLFSLSNIVCSIPFYFVSEFFHFKLYFLYPHLMIIQIQIELLFQKCFVLFPPKKKTHVYRIVKLQFISRELIIFRTKYMSLYVENSFFFSLDERKTFHSQLYFCCYVFLFTIALYVFIVCVKMQPIIEIEVKCVK